MDARLEAPLSSGDRECPGACQVLCIVDVTGRIRWTSDAGIHELPWRAVLQIENGQVRRLGQYRNVALSNFLEQCAGSVMPEQIALVSLKSGEPTLILARLFVLNGFSDDPPSDRCLAIVLEYQGYSSESYFELLARTFRLTTAEQRVLACAVQRQVPKVISKNLGISLATVRSHLQRIRDKLGCRRTTDLAWLALASPEEWNPPPESTQPSNFVGPVQPTDNARRAEEDE